MIFLGDLACPDERVDDFISCVNEMQVFKNETIVLNFEGVIVEEPTERKNASLYNAKKIAEAFSKSDKVIVSLANNHMYDYPDRIQNTKKTLENHGIAIFGLMEGKSYYPYEYTDANGQEYAFFGHCWRVYTRTNANRINNVKVVDEAYDSFVNHVSKYIALHPSTKVICYMHWNYDLERIPFPMLRNVAHKLIDAGAEAIIGNHSHIPQGLEVYKEKIISYCLGNFYLPSGIFFNGTLSYPKECKITYGIQLHKNGTKCLWFETDREEKGNVVKHIDTEDVDGKRILAYSEALYLENGNYIRYFKENRVNKVMVPVFGKYNSQLGTTFQEIFAIYRVKCAKIVHRILKGDRA